MYTLYSVQEHAHCTNVQEHVQEHVEEHVQVQDSAQDRRQQVPFEVQYFLAPLM